MLFEGTSPSGKLTSVAVTDEGELTLVGALTDAELRAEPVEIVDVTPATTRTPSTTSTAASAESQTLLAANSNRKALLICNAGSGRLYASFSSPATTANAFAAVNPFDSIQLDQPITGAIYGLWERPNGTAQVTEFV